MKLNGLGHHHRFQLQTFEDVPHRRLHTWQEELRLHQRHGRTIPDWVETIQPAFHSANSSLDYGLKLFRKAGQAGVFANGLS